LNEFYDFRLKKGCYDAFTNNKIYLKNVSWIMNIDLKIL